MRSSFRTGQPARLAGVWALGLLLVAAPPRARAVEGGRFGGALRVEPSAYAAAEYSPVYFLVPLTVECWAKLPPAGPAAKRPIVLIASEPRHSAHHWEIYCDAAGLLGASFPGYDPKQVKSDARLADGQWHYLAVVFDGQSVRLSVDGKQVARQAVRKTGPYPDTGPLTFGAMEGVAPAAGALIDEVRISRVERAVDRVPDAPFAADADTAGLWHFDEDAAAYDKSGFADASATRNPARLEQLTKDAPLPAAAGGFDATRGPRTRWADMDHGTFFSSTLGLPNEKANVTPKAISIRLGPAGKHAVAFDTEMLRVSGGWAGDFVKIYNGREGLAQHPDAGGPAVFSTRPGPGWARQGSFADPRPDKLGPLPKDWARYRGLYAHGQDVVLSYTVGPVEVLEMPGVESAGGADAFVRVLNIGPSEEPMTALIAESPGAEPAKPGADAAGGAAVVSKAGQMTRAALVRGTGGATIEAAGGRILLTVPGRKEAALCKVAVWSGPAGDAQKFDQLLAGSVPPIDLHSLTRGGPARYPQPILTRGELGKPDGKLDGKNEGKNGARGDGTYLVDTLTAPDDNPWKSFLRFGGLDFFSNGDAAVCSVSGDVWVVGGIDDTLRNLRWRRYATGLFQPLGLKVVDDKIYVLGRDQITRLHDHNGDGEADFYENFNNDCKVTPGNGHAYTTGLETDREGNFYYCKCGDSTSHGGTVLRVSKDGSMLDVFATGVRNSNGLGADRYGQISEADNEGEWVPASRIDRVKRGAFLGFTPMAHAAAPPKDPGKPLVWMPQDVDNSSGGQVWVAGDRWGLPEGDMLHTSYGASVLMKVMTEEVDGVAQGAVWRFPFRFDTGVMRGRFRPQDGQLYLCGLRGWQTAGARDGALQRVRYAGGTIHQPAAWHARANGILLSFACPLEKKSAEDLESWEVLQWNYKWSGAYGSPHLSVRDPRKHGYDLLTVKSARVLKDGKTVFLEIPDLQPAMTTKIEYGLTAADGTMMKQNVHCTIHAVGPAFGEEGVPEK